MPRPRINEVVTAKHFTWKLRLRLGVYYADGRANKVNAGRHSLGTRDRTDALSRLHDLDAMMAAKNGLAPQPTPASPVCKRLPFDDGRTLYEEYLRRPQVAGGVRSSTFKRYKSVFDKFLPFAKSKGAAAWNDVTNRLLNSYATHLEELEYYGKTIRNELTTLVQAFKWLSEEGHLTGVDPPRVKLRKIESQRAYCYRPCEVEAMLKYCREAKGLAWLGDVIVALACTGLRIGEIASMRWSDIDMASGRLTLTDETGRGGRKDGGRRELKSARSRSIPIHSDLQSVLNGLARIDKKVFHGPRGGRLKPDTVRNILVRRVINPLVPKFKDPSAERGFENGRLHSFRHYFASMCANRGVPERIVMEWLGHKDSEMVRHYYHLHDEESRRHMENLDLLGNKAGEQSPGNNGTANLKPEAKPSEKSKPRKRGRKR